VLRALRRTPSKRYPTVVALKAALDHPKDIALLNLRDRLQPMTRWRRNLRIARHLAIVVLLPVLSQVILFLWLWHHFARTR
jgi:hypothetical protein